MKCGKVLKKLSLHIDERLEKEVLEKISLHLESCSECRAEYKIMKISHDSLASLGPAEVPDYLAEKCLKAVSAVAPPDRTKWTEENKGLLSGFLDFKWPAVVTSATALAAALVIGLVSGIADDLAGYERIQEHDRVDPAAELLAYEEAGLEDDMASDWVLGDDPSETPESSDQIGKEKPR